MATIKGIYRLLNNQGTYDTVYFKTEASQVIETSDKEFVTSAQKTKWDSKAEGTHKHTSNDITDATDANTANKIVKRDASGNFSAGTITANLSGNAATATKLQNAVTINGVAFDGSNSITIKADSNSHNHDDLYKRKTDDYKITPKKLEQGENINGLYQSGFYVSDSDSIAATIIGRPPGSQGFMLEVREIYGSGVSGRQIQVATMRQTNEIYVRSKPENGEWTSWEGVSKTSHNHDTAYASKSHTHSSSQITDATSNNTANMIVKRDGSGNFSAGTITANLAGNASTATKLQTAKNVTIGNSTKIFDGSENISFGLSEIGAATSSHTHATNTITSLTGYAKATTASALSTGDTLNIALGKLEKALDGKSDTHDHPYRPNSWVPSWNDITSKPSTFNPASHTHGSNEVSKMTNYLKGSDGSAIVATDSLNSAISKLEVMLDGKSNTHTHPYRPNTWVPSWSDVTSKPSFANVATSGSYNDLTDKPTIVSINDSSTTATTQTWSAKKINDSLATKAASSHTHNTNEITGLGSAATLDAGTSANQVLKLDSTGKIPVNTLPSIAINTTQTATNETDAMTKVVEIGDVVVLTSPTTSSATTYICVNDQASSFNEKFKALSSGSDSITSTEINELLKNKVDKVSGKGLSTNDYTTTEKNKLAGIAEGANNYVHPDSHPATMITETSTRRFITDTERTTWNGKANANHTHDNLYAPLAHDHNTENDSRYLRKDVANAVDIRIASADGRGVRFWDSDNYKIYMSNYSHATHGGRLDASSDYNMYFKMAGGAARGFVFKNEENVVAQIDGSGKLYTKGDIFVNGGQVYHANNKPTPAEIGAAVASHGNHVPTTQTANARVFLRNDNTWQTLPSATTSATGIVQLTDSVASTSTTTAATPNSVKLAYDLANSKADSSHTHNSLVSRGSITAEATTDRPAVNGLSMSEVYNNGYPTTYGNVLTLKGKGDGQFLVGWSGTSGGHAPVYVRSKRDMADAAWSDWAQLYTTANKPTAADIGMATLTRGSYLTGNSYNGTGATTWAVDATTAATANKVAARDGAGDIAARLMRSEYANQSTISGAMAFRVAGGSGTDNYIRFCSDTAAIRTFLNVYSKAETYTKTEMDNRYVQKASAVFSDTIVITTPVA